MEEIKFHLSLPSEVLEMCSAVTRAVTLQNELVIEALRQAQVEQSQQAAESLMRQNFPQGVPQSMPPYTHPKTTSGLVGLDLPPELSPEMVFRGRLQ